MTVARGLHLTRSAVKITLYIRTYPVLDAPVAYSVVPFPTNQRHTFTRDGQVYAPVSREIQVTVPDGAFIDTYSKMLCWQGETKKVRSTGVEVNELVRMHSQGFSTAS